MKATRAEWLPSSGDLSVEFFHKPAYRIILFPPLHACALSRAIAQLLHVTNCVPTLRDVVITIEIYLDRKCNDSLTESTRLSVTTALLYIPINFTPLFLSLFFPILFPISFSASRIISPPMLRCNRPENETEVKGIKETEKKWRRKKNGKKRKEKEKEEKI